MGIEPTLSAWKAEVLPLNYTRKSIPQQPHTLRICLLAFVAFAHLALVCDGVRHSCGSRTRRLA